MNLSTLIQNLNASRQDMDKFYYRNIEKVKAGKELTHLDRFELASAAMRNVSFIKLFLMSLGYNEAYIKTLEYNEKKKLCEDNNFLSKCDNALCKKDIKRLVSDNQIRLEIDPKYIGIIQELQEDFPKLFVKKPAPKKALKVGIRNDLRPWAIEKGYTDEDIDNALYCWCRGTRYSEALHTGIRYDLYGNETKKASLTSTELLARDLQVDIDEEFTVANVDSRFKFSSTGLMMYDNIENTWFQASTAALQDVLANKASVTKT